MGGLYSPSVRTQNSSTSSGTSNSASGSLCRPNRDTFERTPISASAAGSDGYVGIGFITPNAGTKTSTSTTYSSNVKNLKSQITTASNGRKLTSREYEELASVIAGIETDVDGNHSCTYEETLKYGQILSNLRKYGITTKSTTAEKAAAAAGADINNNLIQFTDFDQFNNFGKALVNLYFDKPANNNNVFYGPYEFNLNDEIEKQKSIIILPPSTDNIANTIKAEYEFVPPDKNNEFGYVFFNNETYPLLYMKLDKDKEYYCRIWHEDFRVQLDSAGIKWYESLIKALANLSFEEPENKLFQDSSGNTLQKGNLITEEKNKYKSNTATPKWKRLTEAGKFLLGSNVALNALTFFQNGLTRNNDEIIFLSYSTGEKGAIISKSTTYLTPNMYNILHTETTPTEFYAIDSEGNLYKIDTSRNN